MSAKDRITLSLNPETTKRLTLVANYRKGAKSALVERTEELVARLLASVE